MTSNLGARAAEGNTIGFGRDLKALFRRLGEPQQADRGANPIRFEDRGDLRPDLLNLGNGIPHHVPPQPSVQRRNSLKQIVRDRELPPRPR